MSESHWPTATLFGLRARGSPSVPAIHGIAIGSKLAETLAAMFEGGKMPPKQPKTPPDLFIFLPPTPAGEQKRASGAHFYLGFILLTES